MNHHEPKLNPEHPRTLNPTWQDLETCADVYFNPIRPTKHFRYCKQSKLLLLEGSWVVKSRVLSPLIEVITTVILLITLFITTHDPPSTYGKFRRISLGRPNTLHPGALNRPYEALR